MIDNGRLHVLYYVYILHYRTSQSELEVRWLCLVHAWRFVEDGLYVAEQARWPSSDFEEPKETWTASSGSSPNKSDVIIRSQERKEPLVSSSRSSFCLFISCTGHPHDVNMVCRLRIRSRKIPNNHCLRINFRTSCFSDRQLINHPSNHMPNKNAVPCHSNSHGSIRFYLPLYQVHSTPGPMRQAVAVIKPSAARGAIPLKASWSITA